ncbi:MAG: HNH endonuclease [Lachnospiraceae bacterium]|nr:HNH endonuclease [Lachnospiraceae bacterium]
MYEYLEQIMHQSITERPYDSVEKLLLGCRNAFELTVIEIQKQEITGERGNSKCIPKDSNSKLAKTLNDCGVDGIEYKNGVADLSPTSKGEVQIEHMVGGEGKMGTKARQWNFGQADNAMATELNADPSAAKSLGLSPKNGNSFTSSDIKTYRKNNDLTWHELNDTKTMQLVPTEVNAKFTHLGGVGEINAGAYSPGGFAAQ